VQLHGLHVGQYRSHVPLADLGNLKLALALGEAIDQ
jgi:hypothetical protein